MNSLNTVYFPGTEIYSIRQYPLFLLFQKIHLIQPVEDNPNEPAEESSDSFIKSGFCQVHTPCPLGENRERFLKLVEDIRNRKDDYAAQLKSLTLAAMTGWNHSQEDTEQDIINSMFSPTDLKDQALKEEKEQRLWQARLVLAIGEILDIEEEEIARNLAMLEEDQTGLFKELTGESDTADEDTPFAELLQVESNLGSAHSGNIKKRFNSWKTLFLEGITEAYDIFLTTSQDGGDCLLELYEKETGLAALLAADMELPGLIGWNGEEASKTTTQFINKNKELLSRIHETLDGLCCKKGLTEKDVKDHPTLGGLARDWHTQLEVDFPAKQFGRIPVKLYVFPGHRCSELMGKTQSEEDRPQNGMLVIAD